jgi:LytS/YehU family sensor histidine kinase
MFWLVLAGSVMSWFIWRGCCTRIGAYFWISFFTASLWIALWLGNAYVSQLMDYFFSWQKEPIKRLVAGLISMTVYTIGAVYGIVLLFKLAGFNVGDRMYGTYFSTIVITLIITMFMTGRSFLVNWRQAAVDAEASKRESINAKYESLKSQVNPHFLFNSLNALTNLVYQDQDKAVKFIKELADVYRYVLDTREKEVVPLEGELKFLQAYIYLQQIRFGEKLKIELTLTDVNCMVAPLALQMLVENAIKHNEISEEHPLTIRIFQHDQHIVVENTIQRKSILPQDSPGLGLENIRNRYEFLSNNKVEVHEDQGRFRVALPIIQLT